MGIKFEMLTLNEENVNRIFNDCLVSDETRFVETYQLYKESPKHTVVFDLDKVTPYINTIHYMIGQLDAVHQQDKEFHLKSGIVKYNKKAWTKDMSTLIHFYYLGMATNYFSAIDDTTKTIELRYHEATLAPNDPDFEQWFETEGKNWQKYLGQ